MVIIPLQDCHIKYLLDTSRLNVKPMMKIMYWDRLVPDCFLVYVEPDIGPDRINQVMNIYCVCPILLTFPAQLFQVPP